MPASPDQTERKDAPELSTILVVGGQRQRAAAALQSLLEQNIIDRTEILLFDLGPEHCPPLPGSDHPRVKMTRRGPNDLLAKARADGVRNAASPIVCFIEEHCEMQPGAAEAIVRAFREPWAGVGGDFINKNPNAGWSNQAFRMNYGRYVRPPQSRGPVSWLAGQNSAFRRDVLLRYEHHLEMVMSADLVLQWEMGLDGYSFLYDPAVKIAHRNENTARSLCAGVFYWNWCFSNVRARIFRWSPFYRVLRIALAPLVPFVRLARVSTWMFRLGGSQFLGFLCDVPFVFLINSCAAAGQVVGLVNKLEPAARVFSQFEMNEPRLLQAET